MILKVLNGFSQAAIIVLALVLVTTITTKHSQNLALESFQRQVNQRFDDNKAYYDGRIKNLEDNLNTYQQTRESRAKLYAQRLDELYNLYKQDPDPIDKASSGKIVGGDLSTPVITPIVAISSEDSPNKSLPYIESKINKVDEKVDSNINRLSSRLDIVEQRVLLLQSNRNANIKVVQNNNNLQTVNNK